MYLIIDKDNEVVTTESGERYFETRRDALDLIATIREVEEHRKSTRDPYRIVESADWYYDIADR